VAAGAIRVITFMHINVSVQTKPPVIGSVGLFCFGLVASRSNSLALKLMPGRTPSPPDVFAGHRARGAAEDAGLRTSRFLLHGNGNPRDEKCSVRFDRNHLHDRFPVISL
jgi:hypothetical protein